MSLSPLNLPDEEAVSPLGLLPQREFIAESLRVLHDEGAVVELRAFRRGEVVPGYYDGHDRLARDAWNLDCDGYEVYATLNEIAPELLARATNECVSRPASTTADCDVVRRRWLLLDIDAGRPASPRRLRRRRQRTTRPKMSGTICAVRGGRSRWSRTAATASISSTGLISRTTGRAGTWSRAS